MAPRECKGPRLFVEGLCQRGALHLGSALELPSDESHYIRNVLRLAVGEAIEIADPDTGDSYAASISSVTNGVTATIAERLETPTRNGSITILCALCKGQKNELICDWATELGCSRLIFWQAERSIVRLRDAKDAVAKEEKFANAGWAAAQQSRQPKPPQVKVALSLLEALALLPSTSQGLKTYCSLEQDAPLLSSLPIALDSYLVIGPEGDLTPKEMETLRENGFQPASLGREVLRSELAVVTAVVTITSLRTAQNA
jgi:16S rRNA (uracil1498-N3)-methyltransferase